MSKTIDEVIAALNENILNIDTVIECNLDDTLLSGDNCVDNNPATKNKREKRKNVFVK